MTRTRFNPDAAAPPPYLSSEAVRELVARGIAHLVLDVPSADRLEDGGALTAHRLFFGLPAQGTRLSQAQRADCTITELACIERQRAGWLVSAVAAGAVHRWRRRGRAARCSIRCAWPESPWVLRR